MKSPPRLVVVANRLPASRVGEGAGARWERSPGGLVSAVAPVMEERGGVWIGWDGGAGPAPRPGRAGPIEVRAVALSRGEVDRYYHGFCNTTLWPLYHDAIVNPEFHRAWWDPYIAVNQRFAAAAARASRRKGVIWVHDYQLQLVPRMIRERKPSSRIGFFLHIPFPPDELFAWLPWRSAILRGLLGADVIGFQTQASAENFVRVAKRYAGAEGTERELTIDRRSVRVMACPISIPSAEFEKIAASPSVRRKSAEIKQQLAGRKLLLGVDRLDYTKGIPLRLAAFHELLQDRKLSVNECVMVQIAVPSRESVPGYEETRREVEGMVGRINGEFSMPGKVAVHYFRRSLSREELVAYYLAADVMLVTPLRDGMNLVAKEYVMCRDDGTGVLVLSEFAGAARELRRALLVNPRDVETLKKTIVQAVRMPEEEQRMRMAMLRSNVRRHDVHDWSRGFLEVLDE
ncbi:MAG: trehalose-6-phosphate synthase [Phycisphaerales bacterium]|nr:trehalose-6-phosphate synthase [Phycisphaerales bacterium]